MKKIAVIGLGYVGLPLARLFATKYSVLGLDINRSRIAHLQKGIDKTLEVEEDLLKSVLKSENSNTIGLYCSFDFEELETATIYIVTVPTPVDSKNQPDLTALIQASKTLGKYLKKDDIVIYESTVYPGATEEVCVPILEKQSGLKFNKDFFAGYSPERINPGDKLHRIEHILKVTSGSTPEVGMVIDKLYASVIEAGTHLAPSIKVAEAAKVIENAQRDINIAFVNELAKIFNLLDIDTQAVLEAASTKWNFIKFQPGLVGGHCIGVDPYYLAQKAQQVGYNPEIILAGRRVNDSMGEYVGSQTVKLMLSRDIALKNASILILGITFKENCPDVRNTKVVDVVSSLKDFGLQIDIHDPNADPEQVQEEYGLECSKVLPHKKYSAIILAVAHKEFLSLNLENLLEPKGVIYDVKGVLGSRADKKL
ncbi:nucleotide sugar dehydrogenase [Nonlabens sp. MB-3u-79]|uniref:nucleotide sugar dehydrogenase n=1 Tax=Nonlabens sp. MB-3u-79 TaxID=2058134 RepID=UPI000C3025CF|nr:nucleotide sugar dehydrogenase [Nonlabens sp. MB-3u-79]AUC79529.1 nucleotide sugar dehydrogenase [Nonlabens sp. MB-3u-79]